MICFILLIAITIVISHYVKCMFFNLLDKELWFAASSLEEAEKFVKDYFDKNNMNPTSEYLLKQV